MVSPIIVSLSGLAAASKQIEKSAQNIAAPKSPQSTSDNAVDIVDLSVAAQNFKASTSVIKVADKTEEYLLDILT